MKTYSTVHRDLASARLLPVLLIFGGLITAVALGSLSLLDPSMAEDQMTFTASDIHFKYYPATDLAVVTLLTDTEEPIRLFVDGQQVDVDIAANGTYPLLLQGETVKFKVEAGKTVIVKRGPPGDRTRIATYEAS